MYVYRLTHLPSSSSFPSLSLSMHDKDVGFEALILCFVFEKVFSGYLKRYRVLFKMLITFHFPFYIVKRMKERLIFFLPRS
jgi:hypothetical protein